MHVLVCTYYARILRQTLYGFMYWIRVDRDASEDSSKSSQLVQLMLLPMESQRDESENP